MNALGVFLPSVRRRSTYLELLVYTAGSVFGASVTVSLAVLMGVFIPAIAGSPAIVGTALVACIVVAREADWLRFPIPSRNGQIPPSVATKGYPVAHLQFGFEMGTGLRTFLPTAAPHFLVACLVIFVHSPLMVLPIGVGFGISRAANLWLSYFGLDRQVWSDAGRWDRCFRTCFAVLTGVGAIVSVLSVT